MVGLVLSVGACGSAGDDGRAPSAGSPAASSAPVSSPSSSPLGTETAPPSPSFSPSPPVPSQLAFTAKTVSGESFEGAAVAGQDTVLWFWAPWCTICARSAPTVKAAAEANPEVTFVGVAGLSSDAGAMEAFVDRHEVGELTHLADTGGDLYTRFGVTQQHTFVLVDADGSVTTHPAYGKDVDLGDLIRSTFG